MELLPGWKARLQTRSTVSPEPRHNYSLPKSPDYYAGRLTYVDTRESAQALVELAQQRPLSHIGIDTEYQYDRPGIPVKSKKVVNDPRSIRPLLLSLALAESTLESRGQLYSFVADLRQADVLPWLNRLLQLPVCFVGHNLKNEWFCLWQRGLVEPRTLWDTWVHEKAQSLGLHHWRYRVSPTADEVEEAGVKEDMEEQDLFRNSLVSTCHRYGIPYAMAGEKTRLQKSFLTHTPEAPFTDEQIQYAAEDAIAAARLYPPQVMQAARTGILLHLITVEMPWVTTNVRIEWNGVRIDSTASDKIRESCERHRPALAEQVHAYGINNVRSHKQLQHFFQQKELLPLFRRKGKFSFDKKQLKQFKDRHPAISLIRALRRIDDLSTDQILMTELIGRDERLHPEYRQLGTHTGRQTSQAPNVLGLDRALRPMIIPEEGYGIGEVDWAQIEVGIAAAVYQDAQLTDMFNSGDVYSAMAQQYFGNQLSPEDRTLSGTEFKKKYLALRDQMKTCTLGLMYGLTPRGLALFLNTTPSHAAAFQDRFLAMFPTLKQALVETVQFGTFRGYALTQTGLRRYRAKRGEPSFWERNWMKNYPVQGTAAVLFKLAGNRLDQLYQTYRARLIIPLHDSFIFEAPFATLEEVTNLTARVMCETVREYFPELRPRADINISHPECWNKDGDANAFSRWLENPLE